MRKGKNLIGMPVISETDGANLGRVKDLIFDHDANHVLAFLMSERDLFGLIDAQVIPWTEISSLGPDAITVLASTSRVKAGEVAGVRSVMHRNTALSGTRVYTTDGRALGTLADTFIEEAGGRIQGYELSSGFVSDNMSGKRFLPADYDLSVGRDVALVPPAAASELAAQEAEPGGVSGATQSMSQSISQAFGAAKERLTETYESISTASVEKQKAWVVGKVAGRDVLLPDNAPQSTFVPYLPPKQETSSATVDNEIQILSAVTPSSAADDSILDGIEIVDADVLVRKGEVITQLHADHAASAGVLAQLMASAASGAANEHVTGFVPEGHARAAAAVIGQPASHEVIAPDGNVVVAEGQIITPEIMEYARQVERDKDVIAAAGMGAVASSAQNAGAQISHHATNFWEAAKQKVGEWTSAAQDKKTEMDASSLQARINHALGRPVTRVILDAQDNVILNTNDIITHAAIESARSAGALDILLDSVYDAPPEITPDMMRVGGSGGAALENQPSHSGESEAVGDELVGGVDPPPR
jgi:uncharacterized protein YrrD